MVCSPVEVKMVQLKSGVLAKANQQIYSTNLQNLKGNQGTGKEVGNV